MTLDERAKLAAQLTGHASMWFHGATLAEDRNRKRQLMTKAFRSWSLAARQVGFLQGLAPNCARQGFDDAAAIADVVEAREG